MSRLGFMPTQENIRSSVVSSSGIHGCDFIWDGDTDEHAGTWSSFIALAGTVVVSSITDNGDNPSTGITSGTIPVGTPVTANGVFTAVTMTSGTIILSRA